MATISACAVGSLPEVTRLVPSAITLPSFTTIAPNGPPRPERTFSIASSMAFCMNGFPMASIPVRTAEHGAPRAPAGTSYVTTAGPENTGIGRVAGRRGTAGSCLSVEFGEQGPPAFPLAGRIRQRLQPFAPVLELGMERGFRLRPKQQRAQGRCDFHGKIAWIVRAKKPDRSGDAGGDHRHRSRQGFADDIGPALEP